MVKNIIESYLRSKYRRVRHSIQRVSKLLNPAKYFARKTLKQIKADDNICQKKIPNIVVEINNTCNLNCIMCGTKSGKRPKGFMSLEKFTRILDTVISPNGQRDLVVHTVGEPLMHPEFDKIAEAVHKRDMRLLLTTNGLLLKKYSGIFEKFPGLFVGINVSVDGASKGTYDKIRVGGKFESLIENLKWLTDFNRGLKQKIPIKIQAVISTVNLHEIPDYFNVYTQYVKPEDISFYLVSNLSANQGEGNHYFSNTLLESESKLYTPCLLPFVQMHILFDGRVSVCCRDYHGELIMGDINNDNWRDIWGGEKYENIRRLHSLKQTTDLPMCNSCYHVPSEFSFVLDNYIHYLVCINRIGKTGLTENVNKVFSEFSSLYHKKAYNTVNLTNLFEVNK